MMWVSSDPGQPSDVTSQGTYTVTRTWSGSAPPPTTPVYILETSRAVGTGGIYGTTPGSGTAQDAFNDPPVPTTGGVISSGKKLIQVDGSSGKISLSGTISASGNTPAGDYSSYQGNTAVYSGVDSSFSWDFDSRAVMITCPTIEDSYYKGAYEPDHGTDKYDHLRDPITSAIVTDSAVAYQNASSGGMGGSGTTQGWQVNNIAFTANAANFASPAYQWSLSGPSEAFLAVPTANPVSYSLLEPKSDKFPLQGTLTVKVTDSDGAVGTNTFGITWHLPYEETAFLGSVPKKAQLKQLYGPVHQGDFADVQQSEAGDIDIGEGFDAAGAIVAATGQEEAAGILEIIGKLAKVSDFKYHYGGESVHYGTQNGQDKWTATLNNPDWAANVGDQNLLKYQDPRTGAYDGWVFCDLSIWEVKLYHHMTWEADKYTLHGYDSTGYVLYADPIDKIEEEPYYTEVSTPPTAPGP